jgi:hypothetical protein
VLLPKIITEDEIIETTPTPQPAQSLLFDLTTQDVTWVQFSKADGTVIEVERKAISASWVVVGETEETSDSNRVASIIGMLVNLPVMRSFDVELGFETIGLDNPAYTIIMRTFSGDESVTNIGKLNQVGSGYYVQVDDEPAVLVAKLVIDEILSVFTEPPIMATPTPEVTSVTYPVVELTPTP